MAISDVEDKYDFTAKWWWKVGFGSIISGLILGFMWMGARGYGALPVAVVPELTIPFLYAIGFFAATRLFIKVNGGFVLHTHVFMFWLVGIVMRYVKFGGFNGHDISKNGSSHFAKLHIYTVGLATLGLGIGHYLGGLLAAAIIGLFNVQASENMPPYPGFYLSPGSIVTDGAAFGAEIIFGAILSSIIAFMYLRNKTEEIPYVGGLVVLALTLLGLNVTGPAYDGLFWIAASAVKCTFQGAGGCFDSPETPWWWALWFGAYLGSIIGVIVAYFAAAVYSKEFFKARISSRAAAKNSEGEATPMVGAPAPAKSESGRTVGNSLFEQS